MSGRDQQEIVIVGGGLVGSLAAIFLARRGLPVAVHERFPDLRETNEDGGRSINLVVASRGIRALAKLGLVEQVLRLTVPVTGRMMHSLSGELTFQPYGRDESECNYSISRAGLNRFLVEEAERRGVRFFFRRKLVAADLDTGHLTFEDEETSETTSVHAPLVIGADGAASAVRRELVNGAGIDESVDLLEYGYKELLIPADEEGGYRIEKNALHIWPRGRIMLMALPNLQGSFTVTLYMPNSGAGGFESLTTEAEATSLFEREFADAIPLIPNLASDFLANPTGVLGTVRCHPWHMDGRVLLIGDAAHAIVPFFGQGMNCGFEDCRVLDELIERHGTGSWGTIFEEFTASRKENADAIAGMALQNFVEMRDHVGDERFLLAKRVEHRLEERLPREYRSRYSMVMYGSEIPYRVAQGAGEIQRQILGELCDGLDSVDDLDEDRARRLIRERLAPYLTQNAVSLDY
ncbi:MAG: FAD-dependent monooxygenase [Acidobacteriota bacterium]|nr:FAD-dependent monooxygenase [Acidobacteriota bacterium]